eukprot:1091781-Prymnesium_polylepis.1
MAPKPVAKRKAPTAPPAAAGHGGTGRGQGRKAGPKGLGAEVVDEGTPHGKKQQCLADLLGERFAKKTVATPVAAAPAVADLIGARVERQGGDNADGEAEAGRGGERQPWIYWDFSRQDDV